VLRGVGPEQLLAVSRVASGTAVVAVPEGEDDAVLAGDPAEAGEPPLQPHALSNNASINAAGQANLRDGVPDPLIND